MRETVPSSTAGRRSVLLRFVEPVDLVDEEDRPQPRPAGGSNAAIASRSSLTPDRTAE